MTNISKDISTEELANLYYQKWEIEKKYHTLKNKIKFESITGNMGFFREILKFSNKIVGKENFFYSRLLIFHKTNRIHQLFLTLLVNIHGLFVLSIL